ncbi:unnamed protein product [Moneuplotes crassus]|uniref:Uncharacterized protein n=1 Tax=Euplotes crassus TaxID=5936 RepID=A0AAD1UMW9_EUPCR|nr:unnamed protein product [Moneuplotes crassus]
MKLEDSFVCNFSYERPPKFRSFHRLECCRDGNLLCCIHKLLPYCSIESSSRFIENVENHYCLIRVDRTILTLLDAS